MMFQKMMPALAGNPFSTLATETPAITPDATPTEKPSLSQHTINSPKHPFPKNINEFIVEELADSVIKKFNACTCEQCRKDIVLTALNYIPAQYTYLVDQELYQLIQKADHKPIYKGLIKAVLQIRANPNH